MPLQRNLAPTNSAGQSCWQLAKVAAHPTIENVHSCWGLHAVFLVSSLGSPAAVGTSVNISAWLYGIAGREQPYKSEVPHKFQSRHDTHDADTFSNSESHSYTASSSGESNCHDYSDA